MSVIPGGSHDIQLDTAETSPATSLSLVLAKDAEGNKRWRELRAAPIPPRQSTGELQWTHKDPTVDFVFAQDDWSGGALRPIYRSTEANTYPTADGCDLRWQGVATLGMQRNPADFLVINGGAERNATTGWTAGTGVTHTTPTTPVNSGSYSHALAISSSGAAQSLMLQDLANPTVYRSRSVTVIAYLRRAAGTESGVLLRVDDGIGTTDSSTVSTDSYTYVSVTRTIDVAATRFRIDIRSTAAITAAHTFRIDDIMVVPAGGVVWAGKAESADTLYAATGRCVVQWNETDDRWNMDYIHASAATTGIVSYGANILVAFGAAASYIYGTGTTWTASVLVDPADKAVYWTVSRATLWKSGPAAGDTTNFRVYSSTAPLAGGSWSGAYTVGSSDRAITGLYSLNDSLVVGKEDGLHYYLRVYDDGANADLFINATNEFSTMVHPDNFARADEWHGWLYMAASQQSLFRYNGRLIEDLSNLMFEPRISTAGGRPWAFAAEPNQLWMLVDTPTADTVATKTVWLMSLRSPGTWKLHTIQTVAIGDINSLAVNRGYLYGLGRLYNTDLADYVAASYRWTLPSKNVAPAFDASPAIQSSGFFHGPLWHGGLPDTEKAFLGISILCEDLDANHTIAVRVGINGAAPNTTLVGTFSGTARVQTLYFNTLSAPETDAVGRFIQPRFTMATNNTVAPKMYAYAFHSTIRPDRVRVWEMFVSVGDGVQLNTGQPEPVSKVSILNALNTLETQVYPIVLIQDLDGDGVTTTVRVHLLHLERVPEDSSQQKEGMEIWRLVLQEADTS